MADWRQELTTRLEGLGLKPEHEADIVDELGQHLDEHVRERIAGGATEDEARASALAALDAPGELRRRLAAILTPQPLKLPPPGTPSRGRWVLSRWQDIRYSIRSLRRSPVFTSAVIATMALTIGPTTAMLSIGNWLLWRPTPGILQPDRLAVARFGRTASGGAPFVGSEMTVVAGLSYPNLEDVRAAATTFSGIAGYMERAANVAADELQAEVAATGWATAGFFELLGVRPVAGRTFVAADDRWPDGERVAVISHGLSRRAFGDPDAALDGRLLVNGVPVSVVGVLPPEFRGTGPMSRVDMWVPGASYGPLNHWPLSAATAREDDIFSDFIVKLAPGSSVEAVQAELDSLVANLAGRYPDANEQLDRARSSVTPGVALHPRQVDRYRRMIVVLISIGGVLLLLGCANVTNLLMARGQRQQPERGVRLALGASRGRLAMLQLTESTLLAIAGAGVGVLLALWLKDFVVVMLLPQSTMWVDFAVPLDARVLGLTMLVCISCGLLAGVAPAIVGALRDARTPAAGLRQDTARATTGARRTRAAFAAAELALSLALVVGAFLLVATIRNLSSVDAGFDLTGVTLHRLDASNQGYDNDRVRLYYRELYERVRAGLPDARVALSDSGLGSNSRIRVEDPSGGEELRVWSATATGAYFEALGLRIIEGRPLTDDEALRLTGGGPAPVVISDVLAERAFGDVSPLGRQLVLPATTRRPAELLTVVGVVAGASWDLGLPSFFNPTGGPRMELYLPFDRTGKVALYEQVGDGPSLGSAALIVRSSLPVGDVTAVVRAASAAVDASLPVQWSAPLADEIEYKLADRITFAWVSSLLGWLGFVLAAVGLYGLLAQSVAERTREFGIRMAIGGARRHIFGLVLRQAAWIAALGTVAGIGLALWGTRLIEAQLVGVTRTSPIMYAAAAAALIAIVLFASVWPARAATRIEPVDALRTQ